MHNTTAPGPGHYSTAPPPPDGGQKKTHRRRNSVLGVLGAIIALGIIGSIVGGNSSHAAKTASAPRHSAAANAPAATPPAPAPEPSPDGNYSGSCDYTLGSDPVGGTARAIGEIDLTNTGNIGTVTHVRITWPQEGYAPLSMTRNVHVRAGASKSVRFHMPLSSDQVDRLQSWQEGHNFKDGCTYHAAITDTFGQAS